ncbi:ABC transporter substrate-binding protein [Cohnella silvisoli]|uniref:Extracellular solute-binding protein n=1 Tax=Cohnella silvisoli TaxID=2873699 RepID=A0ABV1KXN3_9BACL|nr:extracellular solute-binding protein [Cohnella silvisoli]MCD9024190.1 extracellular solute-binding protein [Cohnella silvisoli]
MTNAKVLRSSFMLVILAILITLTACGGNKGNNSSSSASSPAASSASSEAASEAPKEKVTLRIASAYTPDHTFGPAIAQIIDEFTKQHPEVTVEKEFLPVAELDKKLTADRAANNLPEIFIIFPGAGTADYVKEKKIIDLSEYLNADPDWKDGFISGALDNLKFEGFPGIYAAPIGAYSTGFYYNKELFQQAGVEPPKTWDDLLAVIGKLNAAKITPMAIGASESWRSEHLFTALFYKWNGAEKAKGILSRALPYSSPEVIEPLNKMVQLVEAGAFSKNYIANNYAAEIADFNNGKAAMRYSGSWTVGESTGPNSPAGFGDKVGFFPFPYFADKEEHKDSWMGGVSDSFAVSSRAEGHQKDMAIELVKTLTSTASSKLITEMAHDLTAVKADVDPAKSGKLIAEVSKAMSTGKEFSGDISAFEPYKPANTKLYDLTQAVLLKGITPEKAAKQLDDEVAKSK